MQKLTSPVNTLHITSAKVVRNDDWFDHMPLLLEEFQDNLHSAFPSVYACKSFLGDQNQAVASNRFAFFGVSVKDDTVSIWVVPKGVSRTITPIRDKWLKQIKRNFFAVAANTFTKEIK